MVRRSTGFLLLAIVAAGGLALGLASSNFALASSQAEQVRQPDSWVPMTVDYTVGAADSTVHLRESRRSDGSVRHEMPGDIEKGLTTITDVSSQRYYEFERGVWRLHPLRPLPFGGKPFMTLRRSSVTPVPRGDPRVHVVAQLSDQLTFYEFVGPSGNELVLCPELNMLMVWAQFVDGRQRQTVAVALGEPSVAFAPPAGTAVESRPEPRGGGPINELPSARPGQVFDGRGERRR